MTLLKSFVGVEGAAQLDYEGVEYEMVWGTAPAARSARFISAKRQRKAAFC